MPRPEYFKAVIVRAIERYYEALNEIEIYPGALADKIIEALDLADDILGITLGITPAKPEPNVLIKTQNNQTTAKLDLSKAVLIGTPAKQGSAEIIGEEAPPAALVRNPGGIVQSDTEEEIELKKSQLHAWILTNLPRSMTLKLPGFEKDIQLNLYVRPAPVKMSFIRIFYTQFPEEEDGPQLQLSTQDINLNAETIRTEIFAQAVSRYRKDKQKIEAKIPPPNPIPNVEQMMLNTKYDASQDFVSEADRELWNKTAGKQLI